MGTGSCGRLLGAPPRGSPRGAGVSPVYGPGWPSRPTSACWFAAVVATGRGVSSTPTPQADSPRIASKPTVNNRIRIPGLGICNLDAASVVTMGHPFELWFRIDDLRQARPLHLEQSGRFADVALGLEERGANALHLQ